MWLTAMSGPAAWRLGVAGWQCVDPVTVRPGDLALCVLHNKEAAQRWRTAKVLVIDEISLLHGRLLDVMNAAAQAVRRNLGVGIQLIGRRLLSASTGGEEVGELGASPAAPILWAFESRSWAKTVSAALLTRVFRQSDRAFVELLNKIRVGAVHDDDMWRKFAQQAAGKAAGNVLSATAVCVRPLRASVDKVSTAKFCQLAPPCISTCCVADMCV